MKKSVRTAIVAIAASTALLLTGCGGGSAPAASGGSTKGGDLVIARAADIISMDNTTTFDNNSIRVMQQIMEPLFMVSQDGASIKPWLATGFTISADNLTYTIPLRKDVKFSNGAAMTATDVKFSLDAATKTGAAGWGYINAAIDTITATDPATITITLKYAWAPLIADLSLFSNAVVPNNYDGKTAEEFYKAPVGTGPFVWGSWTQGQNLKLTKNPTYWQKGKPSLDSVTWTVVPDSNTRKLQLQGGQIDINDTPDWSSFASLKSASGITASTYPSTQIDYVAFNQKREPFGDVHIRRAIAYAIDRTALVKAVLFGNGTIANSLLSPGTPFYDKGANGPKFDLATAKKEMAQSTKPDGFETTLLIRSGDANQGSVAQIMQDELKAIGITMKIMQLDPTANKQARLKADFDMTLSAWTMDIPDPDQWTSFAVDPTGGSNSAFTYYNNPDVVAINQQAQRETDDTKRASLYKQLQKQTGEDAFLAYLYYSPYAYAMTDKIKGFDVTPLGNYHLETVTKSS